MGRTADYTNERCSIAATLEVVGDPWTLLILRDAFAGVKRFEQWQERLGVARNVLASRLKTLVAHGVMEAQRYSERPPRQEYVLTAKGLDLNYGTAADLQDQTDFFTQSDVATTRSNARKEAWRGNAQAQDFRSQGEFAAYNGKMQAAGSLLSGASKVDPKWYKN